MNPKRLGATLTCNGVKQMPKRAKIQRKLSKIIGTREIIAMAPVDLSVVLRPYEKEWVALEKRTNKVLAHGKNLREVRDSVSSRGPSAVAFTFVPAFDSYFAS